MWSSYSWSWVNKINEAVATCVYHIQYIGISSWIIAYLNHLNSISRLPHLSDQQFIKDESQHNVKVSGSTEWVSEVVPSVLGLTYSLGIQNLKSVSLSYYNIVVYAYLLFAHSLFLFFFLFLFFCFSPFLFIYAHTFV